MKSGRDQLEFELRSPKQCRSLRRTRKPNSARIWFEKMRQVVDGAEDRPAAENFEASPSQTVISSPGLG
jgi:hypothetical protein